MAGLAYVYIAFGYNTYDTAAVFTPIAVRTFQIDRGRQYEMDKTQAGTATVTLVDATGDFDPNNPSGAYFGKLVPLLQAQIRGVNPVTGETKTIFTGFVEKWTFTPDAAQKRLDVTINLSDGFELLSRAEVVPDSTGVSVYAAQHVDDRIRAALADYFTGTLAAPTWAATTAYFVQPTGGQVGIVQPSPATGSVFQCVQSGTSGGSQPTWPTVQGKIITDGTAKWTLIPPGGGWPAAWTDIFTGNVNVQQTSYNPQSTILGVIQDAADAEFPNVANVYMDQHGKLAFRGRWARFNPSFYTAVPPTDAAPLSAWFAGDRNAAQTFNYPVIAAIEWITDLKNIINACLALPAGVAQSAVFGQLKTNAASITKYGVRGLSIPDLLTLNSDAGPGSSPPGGDGVGKPSANAAAETAIFAQYFVDNYAAATPMISKLEFKSINPSDSLATVHWKFLLNVEIGDTITITETNVGGGGFKAAQFFVEGIHYTAQPLRGNLLDITLSLDLSTRVWYSKFAGVTYYTGT